VTRLPPPSPAELPPPGEHPAAREPSASGAVPPSASGAVSTDSTELAGRIRAEIEAAPAGRITFARYMERALTEPGLGYYAVAADRPTDSGDFLTAPETHAIFGWTLARRIESMWAELDRPDPFDIVEHGAGSGSLALALFEGFRRHIATDLLEAARYTPVESNPHRLEDVERRFETAGLSRNLRVGEAEASAGGTFGIGAVPVAGVHLANEFLDALPVNRVVARGGRLLELFVAWRDGFVEVVDEPSTPELAARLADDEIELAEGQVAEICLGLDPWLRGVAATLDRGFVLIVDYGYEAAELYGPRHRAGTLLGYRGHRVVEDPLGDPGGVDLTAHVDFTAVARLAAARGLRTVSSTTQSELLVAAGLEEEWRAFQASRGLTLADYTRARSGIVWMLDPRHMGGFRVVTLAR